MTEQNTILDEAKAIVYGDRHEAYGPVAENFNRIGAGWGAILGIQVTPEQVGLMMVWVKVARQMHKQGHDNLVDIAGYAATLEKLKKEQALPQSLHELAAGQRMHDATEILQKPQRIYVMCIKPVTNLAYEVGTYYEATQTESNSEKCFVLDDEDDNRETGVVWDKEHFTNFIHSETRPPSRPPIQGVKMQAICVDIMGVLKGLTIGKTYEVSNHNKEFSLITVINDLGEESCFSTKHFGPIICDSK